MIAPVSLPIHGRDFSQVEDCRRPVARRQTSGVLQFTTMLPAFFRAYSRCGRRWFAQSSAVKSDIKSETLRNEGRPPLRASRIAAAVAALGVFTSKGRDFSTGHARQQDANRI